MTLSDEKVFPLLAERFVCGRRDIKNKERYAGASGCYKPEDAAVLTTNGAGSSNVQLVIVDPSGLVLHCLPGYWAPDDLRRQLDFVLNLQSQFEPESTEADRRDQFLLAHLERARVITARLERDSKLQDFDERIERAKPDSRFKVDDKYRLKSVAQVIHEQMARRPLLHYRDFDVGAFVAYGARFYDKRVPGTPAPKPEMRPRPR